MKGDLKTSVIKLFHNTPHEHLNYWCYTLKFLGMVHGCLSQRSLYWRPSEEILYGETIDISVYRFPLFPPIWYYNPISFPNDKIIPGYILGISP